MKSLKLVITSLEGPSGLDEIKETRFSRRSAHKGFKVVSCTTDCITLQEIPLVVISVRVWVEPSATTPQVNRTSDHPNCSALLHPLCHQLQWSVEVSLHIISIIALVEEQRSFHVPVTCTGARKYRADVWWTEWVGYSEHLTCYWTVIDGGLRTGEACSTTDINIRHGLLQIIRHRIILAKDNREWANMCSLIRVSFGQRPCL